MEQLKLTAERISLLAKSLPKEQVLELCDNLYLMTDFICEDYPKHKSWFYRKHLPAVLSDKNNESNLRDIIFLSDEKNVNYGVSFIKADEIEKKICTLFVDKNARGLGVGTKLVEASMEALGTTKPMITLADYKLPMFEGLIKKYNWELTQTVEGLYNNKHKELVYNGMLQ